MADGDVPILTYTGEACTTALGDRWHVQWCQALTGLAQCACQCCSCASHWPRLMSENGKVESATPSAALFEMSLLAALSCSVV
jgi:hypothetical protein